MQRTMVAAALLVVLAGCSGDVVAPMERPTGAPRMTTTGTLSVGISGPTSKRTEGVVTHTAGASGGVGPYHFQWYEEWCDNSTTCSAPVLVHESWGTSSSHSTWVSELDYAYNITVQVSDSQSPPATGSKTIRLLGPAAFQP